MFTLILIAVVAAQAGITLQNEKLSGVVLDAATGRPVSNCNVVLRPGNMGTITDELGKFEIYLPPAVYLLEIGHLAYDRDIRKIDLRNGGAHLSIKLVSKVLQSEAVTIIEFRPAETGLERIESIDIRRMPTVYSDVLRTVKILPGVSSNNELSSAFNVRGGNHDENLIYLNGYEIYRPALLRQGVAESQSLINPDLVERLRFFGAAFPATLGDKLTSALEVDYQNPSESRFEAVARADLLNLGLAMRKRVGRIGWSAGVRFANPTRFVNELQTTGDYRPRYFDVQALLEYKLDAATSAEVFLLQADNTFDLAPNVWHGNFANGPTRIRAVDIEWQGRREYRYDTQLAGLLVRRTFGADSRFELRLARYQNAEQDDIDLNGDVYFSPNANNLQQNRTYLKTRTERANNDLTVVSNRAFLGLSQKVGRHALEAGALLQTTEMTATLDESILESSDGSVQEFPEVAQASQQENVDSFSGYLQDNIRFGMRWRANIGIRALYYAFTKEKLLSPRGSLAFEASERDRLSFAAGLYVQPPFYHEFRNKEPEKTRMLRSQKALHLLLGWEHDFVRVNLKTEAFYKRLSDIIPYHRQQLRLIYADSNSHEGYAYGLDVLLQGEVVQGVKSWLSYGFLKSRQREKGTEPYERRLLDQTHTFRFFLQDKMPRFPNVQAHMRVLFGSGFLYHPRHLIKDSETGESSLQVDFDRRDKFKYYFRLDLGVTASIKLRNRHHVLFTAEVLNAWNIVNVAEYTWIHIPQFSARPVRIPQVLTRRFFNLGVEVTL